MRWLITTFSIVLLGALPVFAQTPGERLAFVSSILVEGQVHFTVQIYDFDSQQVTDIGDMQFDTVSELTWSADGRIAFVGRNNYFDYSVQVWDGTLMTITQGAASYSDLTWSADGRLAFVGWRDDGSDVLMWDGDTVQTLCTLPGKCSQPAWGADGRLAFTSPDGAVYNFGCGDCDPPPSEPSGIVIWDQGELITVVDPLATSSSARSPRWLVDGRLVFTLSDSEGSRLVAWDGSTMTRLRSAPYGAEYWSVDGNVAVLSSPYGAGMINVDVTNDALTEASARSVSVVKDLGSVNGVTWSRDGRLAFATEIDGDYGVFVWDGQELITVAQDFNYDKSPAWSADGRLAFVSNRADGQFDLYVWDGQDATRLIALPDTEEDSPVWWTPPTQVNDP